MENKNAAPNYQKGELCPLGWTPLDVEALSRLVEHGRNGVALRGQIQHSFGSRKRDDRPRFMASQINIWRFFSNIFHVLEHA
jgi:hypothetical protein